MKKFDDTLNVIAEIQNAVTTTEICEKVIEVSGQFGLTRIISGFLPEPGEEIHTQEGNILCCEWPIEWLSRYVEAGYVFVDPVINYSRIAQRPFTWPEAQPNKNVNPLLVKNMMGEASECGLCDGYAVPFELIEGSLATISFGGDRVDLSENGKAVLNLLSTYAFGRALELRNRLNMQLKRNLSSREIDCIRWVAEGKTNWEIAMILGVSEKTVQHHLANARVKLNVVNKAQLAAESIRRGYFR